MVGQSVCSLIILIQYVNHIENRYQFVILDDSTNIVPTRKLK